MKVAVYTSITADKDLRKEPPLHEGVDRILFTDRPLAHEGSAWSIRQACSLFTDPRRNSRAHKILAHQYLDEYDYSLWIDGSIQLLASPLDLIEAHLHDVDVTMFRHPARSCLYVEAEGCAGAGYDAREVFADQLAKYRRAGYPENNGLNECAVILRRHNKHTVAFNNAWWSEYCRHSCRDQVSVNYVARECGVRIGLFPGTIQGNPGIVHYTWHQH